MSLAFGPVRQHSSLSVREVIVSCAVISISQNTISWSRHSQRKKLRKMIHFLCGSTHEAFNKEISQFCFFFTSWKHFEATAAATYDVYSYHGYRCSHVARFVEKVVPLYTESLSLSHTHTHTLLTSLLTHLLHPRPQHLLILHWSAFL